MLPKTDKSSRPTKKADKASSEPQKAVLSESQSTDVTMSEVDVFDSAVESLQDNQESLDWEETQPDDSTAMTSDVLSSEI